MKTFLFVLIASLTLSANAQTCVGLFRVNIMDAETMTLIGDSLQKSIWYFYTAPEDQFYNDNIEPVPFDVAIKDDGYTVYHDEAQYKFIDLSPGNDVEFLPHCGVYFVQLQMIDEADTMNLGIYNIPAHQSFEVDSVLFKKGDYFLDLQSNDMLDQFTFEEEGYFLVPAGFIATFANKEEE